MEIRVGDKAKAEALLRKKLALNDLRRSTRIGAATNHVRLEAIREEWLGDARLRLRPRSVQSYEELTAQILGDLNAEFVDELTPAAVRGWMERHEKLSARRLAMHVGALKTMLVWAVKREGMIESNPLDQVRMSPKPAGEPAPRRRAMTDDEAERLLRSSPKVYRRIWLTFLCTGLRPRELVELRWGAVDLDRGELYVTSESAKTGVDATLPIAPQLAKALKEIRREAGKPQATDHVFVNRDGRPWRNNLLKRFRSCMKAACMDGDGYEGLDIHALRYTFCTSLLRNGGDVATVQKLSRHKAVKVLLEIYRHVWPVDRRTAVERLSFGLGDRRETKKRRSASGVA